MPKKKKEIYEKIVNEKVKEKQGRNIKKEEFLTNEKKN